MLLRSLAATGCTTALVAAGALVSPAVPYDPPEPWAKFRTTSVDRTTVQMSVPEDYTSAYIYNVDLDYPVQAGDMVSFYVDTVGGTWCTNHYPYLVLEVESRYFYSYDDGTACPGEQASTQDDGRVSFVVRETGRIGYAEFGYYDEDSDGLGGTVQISDFRVNDEPIYFELTPPPDEPVPVATPYGASLTKPRPCVVRVFAYHDAPLEGQVAVPRLRRFITRVDGRVRSDLIVRAGRTGADRITLRANTGRRIVAVRLLNGQLIERVRVRTGRC